MVKGKIALGSNFVFQNQIEYLRLKWCILGRDSKTRFQEGVLGLGEFLKKKAGLFLTLPLISNKEI